MSPTAIQIIDASLLAVAALHNFSTKLLGQAIHAGGLLMAALPPTIVALLCFKLI